MATTSTAGEAARRAAAQAKTDVLDFMIEMKPMRLP
jgi:hypothetical protein